MQIWSQATEMAAKTPAERNRYVDFLRSISILAVIIGHWMIATAYIVDGEMNAGHLLAGRPQLHWLTWLFQVMPIFFIVGGYSNAVGQQACTLCPAGSFSDSVNSTGCTPCAPGSRSASNATACVACAVGSYSDIGSIELPPESLFSVPQSRKIEPLAPARAIPYIGLCGLLPVSLSERAGITAPLQKASFPGVIVSMMPRRNAESR